MYVCIISIVQQSMKISYGTVPHAYICLKMKLSATININGAKVFSGSTDDKKSYSKSTHPYNVSLKYFTSSIVIISSDLVYDMKKLK